jgi:hypothetical protein
VGAPVSLLVATSEDTRSAVRPGTAPVRIAGLGAYLPARVVTNDDSRPPSTPPTSGSARGPGSVSDHVAARGEATSDLAASPPARPPWPTPGWVSRTSAMVVATTTPDHTVSGTAPLVAAAARHERRRVRPQRRLQRLPLRPAGRRTARSAEQSGLLIGAETLTRIVDPADRGVAVLFGDGAGAVVLVPDEAAESDRSCSVPTARDPSMLWTAAGGTRTPVDEAVLADGRHHLTMRGGDVYRHAVARMTDGVHRGPRARPDGRRRRRPVRRPPGQRPDPRRRPDAPRSARPTAPTSPSTTTATPRRPPCRWPWPMPATAAASSPVTPCCSPPSAPA